jgi:hypothetical protein
MLDNDFFSRPPPTSSPINRHNNHQRLGVAYPPAAAGWTLLVLKYAFLINMPMHVRSSSK